MTRPPAAPVVIVGASVAGVGVARALRAEGHEGGVVLIGAEPDWPYDKPPLSKQLLTGEWDRERTALLSAREAEELALDVRLGTPARHLDAARREVVLADGARVAYADCVIATGAAARPAPWPAPASVRVLRTLADALAIRERLAAGGPVAVVGGGFIGAEVASSARALGLDVTVIDPLALPMERAVGAEPARLFTELAAANGVELRLGHGVEAIDADARSARLAIRLTDGSTVRAASAVVGIGALPNDGWLADSGLLASGGVVCDEFGRAAGAPRVFACGDVACWPDAELGEPRRVEHWTSAREQAARVAHNIAHPHDLAAHAGVPYVWTDQHGWRLQIAGWPAHAHRHELVGELGGERPRAAILYGDGDGRLTGAMSVNWPRALAECRRAISAHDDLGSVRQRLRQPAGAAA